MALIYDATLSPSKDEVLQDWVPRQAWYPVDRPDFTVLGRFRFDDPAGEVGMEAYLLGRADGSAYHVPMTYRGAPLEGGTLMSTMEHSVLGDRWVYDAESDPVYRAVLAEVIRTGGRQAVPYLQNEDGTTSELPVSVRAWGVPGQEAEDLHVVRAVAPLDRTDTGVLLAEWDGLATPVVLARLGGAQSSGA